MRFGVTRADSGQIAAFSHVKCGFHLAVNCNATDDPPSPTRVFFREKNAYSNNPPKFLVFFPVPCDCKFILKRVLRSMWRYLDCPKESFAHRRLTSTSIHRNPACCLCHLVDGFTGRKRRPSEHACHIFC